MYSKAFIHQSLAQGFTEVPAKVLCNIGQWTHECRSFDADIDSKQCLIVRWSSCKSGLFLSESNQTCVILIGDNAELGQKKWFSTVVNKNQP